MFAKAVKNTPVFNTPHLSTIFQKPIPFDARFLLRQLEVIVFPETVFTVHKEIGEVLEVSLKEYPSSLPLYIDRRLVSLYEETPHEREAKCPSPQTILERLENFPRVPYIWGGNIPEGAPEMLSYYKKNEPLTPFELSYLQFKGVDCSGLLYSVTDGYLPRNTSAMVHLGEKVSSPKPLDLILYPGHVLAVLPGNRVIESREFDGVVISDLKERLDELASEDYSFIRWL